MTYAVHQNFARRNLVGTIRLGLCCAFRDGPVRFRTLRAASLAQLQSQDALARIAQVCLANAEA